MSLLSPDHGGAAAPVFPDLSRLSLPERLRALRGAVPGPVVFTTSFGLEDQAITHAIAEASLDVRFATLDTGRLFPETYDVWAETEARYGLRIAAFTPEPAALSALVGRIGINGFRDAVENRKACCGTRKLEPLGRALREAAGWITGLRAEQSAFRSATAFTAVDAGTGLLKLNPLADWSRAEVETYIRDNAIPYNTLHDRGFPSIGCAPCTRAVRVGEPERAGRWWWEDEGKKECGLHNRPGLAPAPRSAQV